MNGAPGHDQRQMSVLYGPPMQQQSYGQQSYGPPMLQQPNGHIGQFFLCAGPPGRDGRPGLKGEPGMTLTQVELIARRVDAIEKKTGKNADSIQDLEGKGLPYVENGQGQVSSKSPSPSAVIDGISSEDKDEIDVPALQSRVEELSQEIATLKAEQKTSDEQIEQLRNDLGNLKEELRKLFVARKNDQTKIGLLERDLGNAVRKEAASRLEQILKTVNTNKADIEALKVEQEQKTSDEQIKQLRNNLKNLKEELGKLSVARRSDQNKIDQLEKSLSRKIGEEIASLQERLNNFVKDKATQQTVNSQRQKLDALKRQIKGLNGKQKAFFKSDDFKNELNGAVTAVNEAVLVRTGELTTRIELIMFALVILYFLFMARDFGLIGSN